MNKKQFTFYAFMLTFCIACGDGSVKDSEDITTTKDDNANKYGNPPKGNNPHKEENFHKVGNSYKIGNFHKENNSTQDNNTPKYGNTPKDDNAIKDAFTDEPNEDFFKNYKDKLKPLEEIFNKDNTKENLTNTEKFRILDIFKELEISVVKPMSEFDVVEKERLKRIYNAENIEGLQVYLRGYNLYTKYINRNNKDISICIQCLEYFAELVRLMQTLEDLFLGTFKCNLFCKIEQLLILTRDDTIKRKIKTQMNIPLMNIIRFDDDNSNTDQMSSTEKNVLNNINDLLEDIKRSYSSWKSRIQLEKENIKILLNLSLNNLVRISNVKESLLNEIKCCSDMGIKLRGINYKTITLDDLMKKL